MPLSICAELREESRVSRQTAVKERDTRLKQLWASHAVSLAMFAEKIERTYADLLRKVDDTRTVAERAVRSELLERKELSVLEATFNVTSGGRSKRAGARNRSAAPSR